MFTWCSRALVVELISFTYSHALDVDDLSSTLPYNTSLLFKPIFIILSHLLCVVWVDGLETSLCCNTRHTRWKSPLWFPIDAMHGQTYIANKHAMVNARKIKTLLKGNLLNIKFEPLSSLFTKWAIHTLVLREIKQPFQALPLAHCYLAWEG
jgi:hypothetical protein